MIVVCRGEGGQHFLAGESHLYQALHDSLIRLSWRFPSPPQHRLTHPESRHDVSDLIISQLCVRLRAVADLQEPLHGSARVVAVKE